MRNGEGKMGHAGKTGHAGPVADAARGNWVDRLAPVWSRPWLRLMRLDRPIGFWLLFWPCAWSSAIAAIGRGDPWLNFCADPARHVCFGWYLLLFFIGAVVMRGAGCVWNDISDRHIDARVERTRSRPIPSGQVSVGGALAFMLALCLTGLGVLLQFNPFTIRLGLSSLLVVAVYPFMKRLTNWPQAVLGLAFGWGALMGWAAMRGSLGWPAIILYAATICWIIAYDTIYAHQDREDDALAGMRSTALHFGTRTRAWLTGFYSLAMAGILAAVVMAVMDERGGLALSTPALAVLLAGLGMAAGRLYWQVRTLDINDGGNCLERFRDNHLFGAMVFFTLLAVWGLQWLGL